MTRYLITILAAAIAGVSLLWFGLYQAPQHKSKTVVTISTISAQIGTCIAQQDYACLVRISYKYPPVENREKLQLTAVQNLAFLGNVDEAFAIYQTIEGAQGAYKIMGAIIVYLVVTDQTQSITKFISKLTDENVKFASLNYAKQQLGRNSYHPIWESRLKGLVNGVLASINDEQSDASKLEIPVSLIGTHYEQLKSLAKKSENKAFKERLLAALDRDYPSYQKARRVDTELSALLIEGTNQDIANFIYQLVANRRSVGWTDFQFRSFISDLNYLRIVPENNPIKLERLVDALVFLANNKASPVCKSANYVELAALYARSGWNKKAIEFIRRWKNKDPENYLVRISDLNSDCSPDGYFRAATTEALLGDRNELASLRYESEFVDENGQALDAGERAVSSIKYELQFLGSLAASDDRAFVTDRLFNLYHDIYDKFDQNGLKGDDIIAKVDKDLIAALVRAGDINLAMKISKKTYERMVGRDQPAMLLEEFLPLLVSDAFRSGFLEQKRTELLKTKR